jgi:hypothetical protein
VPYPFPEAHRRRIRTTISLERFNQENLVYLMCTC